MLGVTFKRPLLADDGTFSASGPLIGGPGPPPLASPTATLSGRVSGTHVSLDVSISSGPSGHHDLTFRGDDPIPMTPPCP